MAADKISRTLRTAIRVVNSPLENYLVAEDKCTKPARIIIRVAQTFLTVWFVERLFPTSRCSCRSGLHILSADLQIEAIRILHVETVRCVRPWRQPAALQFCFHRILVPIVDSVGDVINERRLNSLTRVAGNDERVAKRQVALFPVVLRDFHPQQIGVEVAGLGIIGHDIGNMVDAHRLEPLVSCRRFIFPSSKSLSSFPMMCSIMMCSMLLLPECLR